MPRIASMILAAALVALAAPATKAATKITLLHTASNSFTGAFVAEDQGFFAKRGLDVELSLAQNGSVIAAALVADSAQIGGPTPPVLLQADEQGLDLVVVAGSTSYPLNSPSGVIARTGSGLKGPADLIGRKVGVPGLGGTQDVLAKNWVAASGLDYHKVDWVELQFPQMADALKTGLADAVVAVDPFYTHIVESKAGYDIGDTAAVVPRGTTPLVYASTRVWARNNAAAVAAFVAALDDATAYVKDPAHAAAVRDSIAKFTKLPPQAAASQIVPDSLDAHATPERLAFWIKVSREQGLIKGNPDPTSLIAP